jgi:hypothetical protein
VKGEKRIGGWLLMNMTRMANEGRIRVCASPVADRRQVRGDAESLSSFAMSRKSFKVVAPKAQ